MPIITAVFDDRDAAERAAQALVFRFQIERADVFGADSSDPDGQVAWQRLAGRGIPQADRAFFHEAVTRGHAVVVADVASGHAEEAMDTLESHGAVDLDDRENAFRSAGWTGMSAYGDDAVFTGGSGAGLAMPRGTRSDAGDADNPPGTMLSRGADDAMGTNISGARPGHDAANPPGTMLSRGLDDALGTNMSGARPEHEGRSDTGAPGTALSRGADDALGTNMSGARPEHETGAANPPGTMLSRGADDAMGTNMSGARPEHEDRTDTGAPGTMLSRGADDAMGTNISGARPEHDGAARGLTGATAGREGDMAIPLVEERLTVGKREVTHGRVRIRSYVVETPVEEQVRLREEHVHVERRTVDRPATDADRLFEERSIEATETAEEAMVQKEARVREELTLRKDATERTETVRDTVRRTEVEVEDDRTSTGLPGAASPGSTGAPRTGV